MKSLAWALYLDLCQYVVVKVDPLLRYLIGIHRLTIYDKYIGHTLRGEVDIGFYDDLSIDLKHLSPQGLTLCLKGTGPLTADKAQIGGDARRV